MSSTPRKGWMKREWAKFPIGSKVKCIEEGIYYSGCCGVIESYGIAKSSCPVLRIRITSVPQLDWNFPPCIDDFAYGQLLGWWEVSNA